LLIDRIDAYSKWAYYWHNKKAGLIEEPEN
jgi:hypothetical protein